MRDAWYEWGVDSLLSSPDFQNLASSGSISSIEQATGKCMVPKNGLGRWATVFPRTPMRFVGLRMVASGVVVGFQRSGVFNMEVNAFLASWRTKQQIFFFFYPTPSNKARTGLRSPHDGLNGCRVLYKICLRLSTIGFTC
jgi:hypothetical protein